MSEEIKKNRRGINNETKAVAQLKFQDKDAAANGLFVGHLAEVRVDYSTGKEGSGFDGIEVPRLTFHFASEHKSVNEQRHVYQTLFAINSNEQTIPGGSAEWQVNNVFKWIKHILDVYYLKGRELTEAEEEALVLPFEDYDENNQYVSVDQDVVAKGYAQLFANVVAMLDGTFGLKEGETPKCCYKTANGGFIPVWMKLLRHRRTKKGWIDVTTNGDLGFDSFLGNGAIEIVKGNTPPVTLSVDLSKESIKYIERKKEPNLNNNMLGSVVAGIPGASPMGPSFAAAAEEDGMPF